MKPPGVPPKSEGAAVPPKSEGEDVPPKSEGVDAPPNAVPPNKPPAWVNGRQLNSQLGHRPGLHFLTEVDS